MALTVVVRLKSVVWEYDAVGVGISTYMSAEDLATSIIRAFKEQQTVLFFDCHEDGTNSRTGGGLLWMR